MKKLLSNLSTSSSGYSSSFFSAEVSNSDDIVKESSWLELHAPTSSGLCSLCAFVTVFTSFISSLCSSPCSSFLFSSISSRISSNSFISLLNPLAFISLSNEFTRLRSSNIGYSSLSKSNRLLKKKLEYNQHHDQNNI